MKKRNYFFVLFLLSLQSLTFFTPTNLIAQGCDIWVVAQEQGEDQSIKLVLKELMEKGISPLRVGDIYQLKDRVIQKPQDDQCCLKNLYIVGHGTPGAISLLGKSLRESVSINKSNENVWGPELLELMSFNICPDGQTLYLLGCNTGARCDGSDLLFKLATKMGAKIKAPIDRVIEEDVFAHKVHDYLDYGRWQEANSSMTSPPPCIDSLNQETLRERMKIIEQTWFCPCNMQVYSSEVACAANCPTGLGCFTEYGCEFAYKNNTFF